MLPDSDGFRIPIMFGRLGNQWNLESSGIKPSLELGTGGSQFQECQRSSALQIRGVGKSMWKTLTGTWKPRGSGSSNNLNISGKYNPREVPNLRNSETLENLNPSEFRDRGATTSKFLMPVGGGHPRHSSARTARDVVYPATHSVRKTLCDVHPPRDVP